jgi:hypothetical protein
MDIEQHCLRIIQSPRIRDRFVILCEGEIPAPGRFSPSSYGKNSELPDANFYKACLPHHWKSNSPLFFNSGGRSDVIETYQTIRDIHFQNLSTSRLNPEKVFALLDIDLHSQSLEDYQFATIDEAFQDLFTHGRVNLDRLDAHKIWFTGFIHKEAYFLAPELQEFFDDLANVSHYEGCAYQNNPLNLNHVYQNMIQDINTDKDLATHWHRAKERIMHCPGLELDRPEKLQQSWQTQWSKAMDDFDRTHQLIDVLLSIRKVKPYWEQVHPVNEPTTENCAEDWRSFREDIALEIGRQVYSRQEGKPHEHLACFFKYLYQLEFGQ